MNSESRKSQSVKDMAISQCQQNDILLSICILSYNQAPEMERLLNSLASQVSDEVEVIIRDDSTNNETELLVERFSRVFPIRYFHGEKEGIDRTVIFLTNEAKGEFVWWLGDDDVLPGGVATVLDVIKQVPDVVFIWANYRLVNDIKLAIDLQGSRSFKSKNELLELGGAALGFVSATVFKRKMALTGIDGSKRYAGSLFSNLYLVLHVISQPGEYYYIHGPVVICYPTTVEEIRAIVTKNSGSEIINAGFEVYGITFSNIVREFTGAFSAAAIRRTIRRTFGQAWRGMLVGWVGGWDTPKGKRVKMLKYFWTFPECWIALGCFLVPLSVNKLLYRIYKAFRPTTLRVAK
jgi:abequosyltransferase